MIDVRLDVSIGTRCKLQQQEMGFSLHYNVTVGPIPSRGMIWRVKSGSGEIDQVIFRTAPDPTRPAFYQLVTVVIPVKLTGTEQ